MRISEDFLWKLSKKRPRNYYVITLQTKLFYSPLSKAACIFFINQLNSQSFFVPQRPDVGELEPGVLGAGVVPVLLLAVDALARLGSVEVDEDPAKWKQNFTFKNHDSSSDLRATYK